MLEIKDTKKILTWRQCLVRLWVKLLCHSIYSLSLSRCPQPSVCLSVVWLSRPSHVASYARSEWKVKIKAHVGCIYKYYHFETCNANMHQRRHPTVPCACRRLINLACEIWLQYIRITQVSLQNLSNR